MDIVGPKQAVGSGIEHYNSCVPACAARNFATAKVSIVLDDLNQAGKQNELVRERGVVALPLDTFRHHAALTAHNCSRR